MVPYDNPTTIFDQLFGPNTALTPKIVAHGGGHELRVLKGNPVGYIQRRGGELHPYLSARMEHSHQPLEAAMIEHSRLGNISIDHYHLGQISPAQHNAPTQKVRPSSQYEWPDTSVSASLSTDVFGGGKHPGPTFPRGSQYDAAQGVRRKP